MPPKDAFVGEKDLQQRNTSAVSGKTVADAGGNGVPDAPAAPFAVYAA